MVPVRYHTHSTQRTVLTTVTNIFCTFSLFPPKNISCPNRNTLKILCSLLWPHTWTRVKSQCYDHLIVSQCWFSTLKFGTNIYYTEWYLEFAVNKKRVFYCSCSFHLFLSTFFRKNECFAQIEKKIITFLVKQLKVLMIQEIYIIKHGDRRRDCDHICSAAKLVPTFLNRHIDL